MPSTLTKQRGDAQRMLGMWISILTVFVARKYVIPIERDRQPFYKRFLWAAIVVCISNTAEKCRR